jgi:hypothetical protein
MPRDVTGPDGLEFAGRDFGCGTGWGYPLKSPPDGPNTIGLVTLLTTRDDNHPRWIEA